MKTCRLIILMLLMVRQMPGRCQTSLDTAAILPGTSVRGIPLSAPVKPAAPVNLKQAETGKSAGGHSDKKDQRKVQEPDPDGIQTLPGKNDAPAVLKAYEKSQAAYYLTLEKRNLNNKITNDSVSSYYRWALQNRKATILRQQYTGTLIFVLVVILVLSGLVFSAVQFYIALTGAKKRTSTAGAATSFKASLSGIEVSSSVLGVIILTISIVFFYLYLSKVYPLVSLDQVPVQLPGAR